MTIRKALRESAPPRSPRSPALGLSLSLAGHAALVALFMWLPPFGFSSGVDIIAAGPGEGMGTGSGDAMQVGVASASELFSIAPWAANASLGEDAQSAISSPEIVHSPDESAAEEAVRLDDRLRPRPELDKRLKTGRPLVESPARPFSAKPSNAPASGTSAIVGPTAGSPFPAVTASPGIGMGAGGGSGVPGGSEYGRRIQQALSSHYRYTPPAGTPSRFVIVRIRLDRSGRILSIGDGRIDPSAFVKSSGNIVVDSRVSGALLELNRNPIPFPAGFLEGIRQAVAEIYFQY